MITLQFAWPIAFAALLLGIRIWELRRKFIAVPGKVVAPGTFREMVGAGTGSVILCILEYAVRGTPPQFLSLSICGALIGLGTFLLRGSARKALAEMWSVHVEIRDKHTLVQTGPYSRIRHPIYLGTILEVIGAALLLNAWIFGTIGIFCTALVLHRRIRAEEIAMEEKFGDAWRTYRLRAGPLWPRL
jgi:protein-S-isoprenylcysteine O-methyltransferase Ste14